MLKRLLMIALIGFATLSLGGCARWWNRTAANGGFFGSTAGDYVIIKYSGGRITDVWKIKNAFIQSEEHSDGWLFIDNDGNPIHIGGDMKSVRFNHDTPSWQQYHEWHMDQSSGDYKPGQG